MLHVSAVLTVGRCLSVCLSVTLVYYIQTAKDIVELLFRPGSPIVLVPLGRSTLPNSNALFHSCPRIDQMLPQIIRRLRSASTLTLTVPSTSRSTIGDRAFPVAAACA